MKCCVQRRPLKRCLRELKRWKIKLSFSDVAEEEKETQASLARPKLQRKHTCDSDYQAFAAAKMMTVCGKGPAVYELLDHRGKLYMLVTQSG